ncbi:EAL domain-containing protein [Evansella sp. AB-rgal1]|uniref:EAL domain-containing protein n=1 Tax=Evansella sp. AB-rgal1 TaxID=3242696 RepID=UPI00359D675E
MNAKFYQFLKQEQFTHCFQPIYHLRENKVLGYEALLRTDMYENPMDVFQEAVNEKRLYELDMRSIHKAIVAYKSAGKTKRNGILFLNVYPSTIINQNFLPFLTKIISDGTLKSQEIILEVSESQLTVDYQVLQNEIEQLNKLDVKIAIDDVGKGYSNLESLMNLDVAYIKLDKFLMRDLHISKKKQLLLKHLIHYADDIYTPIIVEGIENELEKEIALDLGVTFGQGFGLCKPLHLSEVVSYR